MKKISSLAKSAGIFLLASLFSFYMTGCNDSANSTKTSDSPTKAPDNNMVTNDTGMHKDAMQPSDTGHKSDQLPPPKN